MIYIIIPLVLLIFYLVRLEHKTLFYPVKSLSTTPKDVGLEFEEVTFNSGGYKIHGWYIHNHDQSPTVIFFHGNAGNISDRVLKLKTLYDIGLNTLIFDYRGYGKSEGAPSEMGLYTDAKSAYDYLIREKGPQGKIIAYGASLGGAVAVNLASRRQVDGLIIESSFSNAKDMARHIYPFIPGVLVRSKLDSIKLISQLNMPKLFYHSPQDHIVPFDLGRKLYERAQDPKVFIELQGIHADGHQSDRELFIRSMKSFLEEKVI